MTFIGIPEWYAGRSLLVTGGTGFMGKVLLEKLLRACPDLERIYIVVREKRGLQPQQRLQAMAKLPVFERLLKERPDAFKQLTFLDGDVTAPNMGLKPEDQQEVLEKVSVVFHVAASLKLEAKLKEAVQANTLGTKHVLDFCCGIKNLDSFLYVSTAFCHCEQEVLEEKIYSCHLDPHDIIRLVEWMDEKALDDITPRVLGPHPNCYTLTKRLAETLVEEYSTKMPMSIARPSIVTPAIYEPLEGWVDSLNGPTGITVGAGKGVIRSMMCNSKHHAEAIPVDVAINGLIAIAWKRAVDPPKPHEPQIPVFNVTQNDVVRMTWGEVLERGHRLLLEYPFDWAAWYPDGSIRTNWWSHTLIVFFFQTLPAYFFDLIFFLCGQRTFMVRVQKRIALGMSVLQYFTMRDWDFKNINGKALTNMLSERDQKTFYMANTQFDIGEYMKTCVLGSRQYCMKEPLSTLPRARRHIRMLYVIHVVSVFMFYMLCGWLAFRVLETAFGFVETSRFRSVPILGSLMPK